ncbi:MAG TPA: PRC-barrel domain-containing protein [Ramlibacter sp.]|nr:PRC-barrel domain-containing protein [Ramlibacter sp.]
MEIGSAGHAEGPGPCLSPATSFYARLVVDAHGEVLGSISDLLLDLERGCVAYAVLSTGGFMGMGERKFAVPWRALRPVGQQFVLDCKRAQLESAPPFDREHWPQALAYGWHERVHAHYHSHPYWK